MLCAATSLQKTSSALQDLVTNHKCSDCEHFSLYACNGPYRQACLFLLTCTKALVDQCSNVCRFSTETSQSSGFALWIYAVPTTSNSTRLIINAGLNPSKAFAPKPDAKLDFAQVKQQAVRTLFSLRPRYAICNAHGTAHSTSHDLLVYALLRHTVCQTQVCPNLAEGCAYTSH